jgi:hypothetical protein
MSHTIFHRHWVGMVCFQSAILERVLAHIFAYTRRVLPLLDTLDMDEIFHVGRFLCPTQYFIDIVLVM